MATALRGTPSVGLLISAQVIVAVKARASESGIEILSRGAVATPEGAVENVTITDPHRLAQAIRTLWRKMDLRDRSAAVTLLSPSYSMWMLRLPEVPERERRAIVRGELEQLAIFPYGSGAFDYLWISSGQTGSVNLADVAGYYADDALVETIRHALHQAGLQLNGVEPASIAMMRTYLAGRARREPVALLCPRERYSDLCVHDGSQVRHLRRIPVGWLELAPVDFFPPGRRPVAGSLTGESLTSPLSQDNPGEGVLSAEWTERGGILAADWTDSDSQRVPPNSGGPAGAAPVQPRLHGATFLRLEIARSLAFYAREHEDEARPQNLVILGPTNIAREIDQLLENTQPIPVTSADPLAVLDLPRPIVSTATIEELDAYAPALGVALGSAGAESGMPRLDISQQEAAAYTRQRAPRVLLNAMAGSAVWLCLSVAAAISVTLLESRALDESGRLTGEITAIKQQNAPALWYQELVTDARGLKQRSQSPVAAILGSVAAAATDSGSGIALTDLQITPDGRVTLEGRAMNTDSVERFALELGRGQSVRAPVIESMRQDSDGQWTFRIVGNFRAFAAKENLEGSRE